MKTEARSKRGWTIILMLVITLHMQAQNLITLKLEDKPLSTALKLLEREGGKNIIFSVTETEKHHVSADIRQKTQTEAIDIILHGTPFVYKERTDYFVIQKKDERAKPTESIQVFASLEAPKEITFSEKGKRMEVRTPAGTTTSLTLSDGTEVLLSANSRLIYDKNFDDEKRKVTLVGEARFKVAQDARRPFIVHTEQLQTKVLGTVFDIKAYPQASPDVTLYEGRVEVSLNDTSPRLMQPGEQASIDKKGKLQLEKASDDKGKWTEGEFAFDNCELRAVMQEIGSWYNISVMFHSRSLLDERIHFRMKRAALVDEVLGVLNDMGIATFEWTNQIIVVKRN